MTKKLYTAVGILKQKRGGGGLSYPYVEIAKQEFNLNVQEMLVWSLLNWRIVDEQELKALYLKKLNELNLDYHTTLEACHYRLMQRGLVAEGKGETGADALYDLMFGLYVVPVSENIFLRLISFFKLTFIKGIPFSSTKRILLKDNRSKGEQQVMKLANQAIFSTAEIIKCVEMNKSSFTNDEEILDTLYEDEYTISENIAYSVKTSPVCRPVLTDVANLYLRQQIVFGGV